jgi:hypothetical protein
MGARKADSNPSTSRRDDSERKRAAFRAELEARRAAFEAWILHPDSNLDEHTLDRVSGGRSEPCTSRALLAGAPATDPADLRRPWSTPTHPLATETDWSCDAARTPSHIRAHLSLLARTSPPDYIAAVLARAGPELDLALALLHAISAALPSGPARTCFAAALCAATETCVFPLVASDAVVLEQLAAVRYCCHCTCMRWADCSSAECAGARCDCIVLGEAEILRFSSVQVRRRARMTLGS